MPLLCLDFANTVGRTKRGNAGEELDSYAGLLRWCRTARLIDADTEDRLRGEAIADMAVARRELGRGWLLRQVLVQRQGFVRFGQDVRYESSAQESLPKLLAISASLARAGEPELLQTSTIRRGCRASDCGIGTSVTVGMRFAVL